MTIAQWLMVIIGAATMALGGYLLLRHQQPGVMSRSEAKSPVFTYNGPPGLIVMVAGAALVAFPFTTWGAALIDTSPAEAETGAPTAAPGSSVEPAITASASPSGEASPSPTASTVAEVDDRIELEAEEGELKVSIVEFADAAASGGAYVATTTPDSGRATYSVDLAGGEYRIWARVQQPDPPASANGQTDLNDTFVLIVDDAFSFQAITSDGGTFTVRTDDDQGGVWDFHESEEVLYADWTWELVSLRCHGERVNHGCDPLLIDFDAGVHTLTFRAREPDARLDAIVITTDPDFEPNGRLG